MILNKIVLIDIIVILQDETWATKSGNTVEQENEADEKSESISFERIIIKGVSGEFTGFGKLQTDPKMKVQPKQESSEIWSKIFSESIKVKQLSNDIDVLKKDYHEDIKTLKFDLKNCLQIQEDTSKSYLSVKKDISEIKAQLEMVYGKKFFVR